MTIGYLRVSTGKQHPANQKDEIERFAEKKNITIDRWVIEIASGSKSEKERKLGRLLKSMRAGDMLIVTEISRLSRTLTEIMGIMGRCLEKGIMLYTTKEGYTFDNSINSKVLCFAFGLVAEIERNLISMRTKEALALRKAEGKVLGRRKGSFTKTKILRENKDHIAGMLSAGSSIASVCRAYKTSRDTFSKFRKEHPEIDTAIITGQSSRKQAPHR